MKKEYRDITWIKGNGESLCKALGKTVTCFRTYRKNHPNITEEQYIDYCLSKIKWR